MNKNKLKHNGKHFKIFNGLGSSVRVYRLRSLHEHKESEKHWRDFLKGIPHESEFIKTKQP